jgi:hypothetical protein
MIKNVIAIRQRYCDLQAFLVAGINLIGSVAIHGDQASSAKRGKLEC